MTKGNQHQTPRAGFGQTDAHHYHQFARDMALLLVSQRVDFDHDWADSTPGALALDSTRALAMLQQRDIKERTLLRASKELSDHLLLQDNTPAEAIEIAYQIRGFRKIWETELTAGRALDRRVLHQLESYVLELSVLIDSTLSLHPSETEYLVKTASGAEYYGRTLSSIVRRVWGSRAFIRTHATATTHPPESWPCRPPTRGTAWYWPK